MASGITAGQYITRIDSNFRLEDYRKHGDGYEIRISNWSQNAFSNFVVVILGLDIDGVTVYQRHFEVEFMEGQSERTFFLPGYDDRIFEVRMRVLAPDYEALLMR